MLSVTVSVIVYLVEMLIAYIVFSYVSCRKYSVVTVLFIGVLIFGSGAVVNLVFSNTVWLNAIYTSVMLFSFAILCFKLKVKTAFVYSIILNILSVAFEFATIFSISALIDGDITDYNSSLPVLVAEASVSKTLYLVSCFFLMRLIGSGNPASERVPPSFYLYPFCTLFAFLAFWYISAHDSLNETNQLLLSCTSLILLIATVVLFIMYRHNMEKENEYIRISAENSRLQTEKAYYDILERQNQQLLLYAHDTKNHLAAIQNLNDDPKIDDYIQQLSEQLRTYSSQCHSGNRILDVIINKYATECELRNVTFHYDVKSCNLGEMDDYDVVSILGNLLDNAVAAAAASSVREVSLATTWRNNYKVIIITNSCDSVPVSSGQLLRSTKKDNRLHGFGLRSVKRTLKKYRGDFGWEYDADRHEFIVTVMIGSR